MDSQTLFVIKVIFGTFAALASILAAWFTYRDLEQMQGKQDQVTRWYAERWNAIQDSGVLELPELAIQLLLKAKNNLSHIGDQISDPNPGMACLIVLLTPIFAIGGIAYFFGWYISLAAAILSVLAFFAPQRETPFPKYNFAYYPQFMWFPLAFLTYLLIVTRAPLLYSLVFALVTLPLCIFGIGIFFTTIIGDIAKAMGSKLDLGRSWITALSAAISIPITLIAFLVGHYVAADAWIPQTLQMLVSNITNDAMTMLVTVLILERAVGERRSYSVPTAIILDLVAAGALACASLWFGLLFSTYELSFMEVWHILWGYSADGSRVELGPYFWAMHTAFLPTIAYLSIIAFSWLAKLIVLPIARILRTAVLIERPHTLTAAALALVTLILYAISTGTGYLEDLAAEKEATEQLPISQE